MRRRGLAASVVLLAIATVARAQPPAASQPAGAALVQSVDAVAVTVSDADRAVAFYRDVLTFEQVSDTEVNGDACEHMLGVFGARVRIVALRLGDERLELMQFLAARGRPMPPDSRANDHWFQHVAIIVRDMDKAYERLRRFKVEHASSGPQTLPAWNPSAGGIRAFYFRDPDGHFLEVLWFPPGKGDPKWHAAGDRLFKGIDHTAIVVRDTDASLRWYRDALGLRVAGESENHGTEQEHLNNVFGARLRITTLRAANGPGIELLEYLAPRDGRPTPSDTRACDLWHWHVRMRTADPAAAAAASRRSGARWVSPGVVDLPDRAYGCDRGVLVRDPDGHANLIGE